jgi:hypothetical protein
MKHEAWKRWTERPLGSLINCPLLCHQQAENQIVPRGSLRWPRCCCSVAVTERGVITKNGVSRISSAPTLAAAPTALLATPNSPLKSFASPHNPIPVLMATSGLQWGNHAARNFEVSLS